MPAPSLALVHPARDLPDWAAAQIIDAHRSQLPDLSAVSLLAPASLLRPLRLALLRHADGRLLGPHLHTLESFAQQQAAAQRGLSALDCKLQLAQALRSQGGVFAGLDPLALAEDLFALFEALAAHSPQLAEQPEAFIARVLRGYGAPLGLFSDEARIAHTLWRAYLAQTGGASPAVAQARQLAGALQASTGALYLIGHDEFSGATLAALKTALGSGHLHLWLQGRLQGRDGAAARALCARLGAEPEVISGPSPWLDTLLDEGAPLRERLRGLGAPAGLRVQAARGAEHEARMAELAIRQWLLAGKTHIAVVSQDRRFARRLRALLERAGVPLRDEAGWALSTSSAAAALGHWLDCAEQGFPFRPLLALLRSAFQDPDAALAPAVDALERQIYRRKTVAGLARFEALAGETPAIAALLAPLRRAAQWLAIHGGERPAQTWSEALLQSLQALPLWTHWAADEAGRALRQCLLDLHAGLGRSELRLGWADFRRLLERQLEQALFKPGGDGEPGAVRLLTLEQTAGLRCEALILAGAAAGAFPGGSPAVSLFNQAVRAELGLPHWSERLQLALARFRNLLDAAPDLLISYAPEDEGDEANPCAWVELLQAAGAPSAAALAALAGSAAVEVAAEPRAAPVRSPRPAAVAALLPETLSASQHQALVDCPYKFHAGASLRLRAPQEPDEPWSRRDFGERVHEVLRRFTAPVAASQRAETETRMAEAASEVFGPDLRARALTRAWLAEFESLIPEITGWLIDRRQDWPRAQAEADLEPSGGLPLRGRADRLEHDAEGRSSVVDYKTGKPPEAADIESGEAVQATHYALLAEPCRQVEYLQLRREDFDTTVVTGAALADAQAGVRARILQLLQALRQGAAQAAHGDAAVCGHCDFRGLCRKGAWADA